METKDNTTVTIQKSNVLAAYKSAKEEANQDKLDMLEAMFGKQLFEPEDVRERIKTFDDAYRELNDRQKEINGLAHPLCLAYDRNKIEDKDVIAYLKLRIICAALNEGWTPQFTKDECRYHPWFWLYTKDEYNSLDDETKSRVVFRSNSYANACGGVSCADSSSDSGYVNASIGSRLAFKSRELSNYAGEQFIDIWADFLFLV